jgi:hypothetical protein
MNSPISRLNVGDRIKVIGVQADNHYYKNGKTVRDVGLTEYSAILKV